MLCVCEVFTTKLDTLSFDTGIIGLLTSITRGASKQNLVWGTTGYGSCNVPPPPRVGVHVPLSPCSDAPV